MRRNVECLPVAEEVLIAAERLDLVPVIADTLITKGSVLADTGRPYEGMSLIETGVRLAEQHGLTRIGLRGRLNLGFFLGGHDPEGAMAALRPALREARRLGDRGLIPNILANIAGASVPLRPIPRGAAGTRGGTRRWTTRARTAAWLVVEVAWHRAVLGIPVDEELAEIEEATRTLTDPQFIAFTHVVGAVVAWVRGDEVTARAEIPRDDR